MNDADRLAQKRIEQAHYRALLLEAELGAVKASKAYRLAKKAGALKAQLRKNPVAFGKKAVRTLLTKPNTLLHLNRTVSRNAFMAQSAADQAIKYQEWILLNEPDEIELDEQRKQSNKFAYKPLISILTPVFNPPVKVLEELIESVLEQTYPNFELCLGNFGDDTAVKDLLTKYAQLDTRVKNISFDQNLGIAGNSNLILDKVQGEFIALLDHDDTLSSNALYENIELLNEHPYDLLYSDKDKIDEQNNRFDPLFKPKWSPEMMLNINYLTHLNVIRTSLVKDIGGWDTETDGAQDWDLFLRVSEKARSIGHIPKVLYHWRVIASSTALSIETKPYALAGQRRAVDKYLAARGIPAHSYHDRTELFIKWNEEALPKSPVVCLYYSGIAHTLRMQRQIIREGVSEAIFVVLVDDSSGHDVTMIRKHVGGEVLEYSASEGAAIAAQRFVRRLSGKHDGVICFVRDDLRFGRSGGWYAHLTGWLSIPEVAAASGRIVDRHGLIRCAGGVVTPSGEYSPLFHGFPKYYQSYIGNAEWVRNLSVLGAAFFVTRLSIFKDFTFKANETFDDYGARLSKSHRLVMTPHATGAIYEDEALDGPRPITSLNGQFVDPYANVNISPKDPMRLFSDEVLPGINEPSVMPLDSYQRDAAILADTFDISMEELEANRRITSGLARLTDVRSVAWFLPSFDAIYAGLANIFSFADYLLREKGLATTFYILKQEADASDQKKMVLSLFPGLKSATFKGITPVNRDRIQGHDIGIATQWATAYPLAKAPNIKRKCYFIQDKEVNFYPQGTISALVDVTYRQFGFMAIANTDGLLEWYQKQYGGSGVVLKSRVDLHTYYPRKDLHYVPRKPYKVFFYARPNMPRNAFELGIAGLKKLKGELGQDVEVITAGAVWDPVQYGVDGLFTNLGKIAYTAVPKLYRSVDAGLMFMFSGHPGVTASELMASGCPVVVNEYEDETWYSLYQHERTCLVTLPTASEVARNLLRCLTETDLRKKLIKGGLDITSKFYDGYAASMEDAYRSIVQGEDVGSDI